MTDMKRKQRVVEFIGLLAESFRQTCTKATFAAYEIGLSDLSVEAIEHGVHRAIRECKFMPSCNELRGLCGIMPTSDRALRAWSELESAIGSYGYYRTVAFHDAATAATVRLMGGWQPVCDRAMNGGDAWETWAKKEFLTAYKSICDHGCSPEACAPLLGYHDKTNGETHPRNLSVIETKLPVLASLPAPVLRLPDPHKRPDGMPRLAIRRVE